MAFHPIPLAQSLTARGWAKSIGTSAKDAQVINGLFEVSVNPLMGTKTVYVQKRAGSTTGAVTFATDVIRLKHGSVYHGAVYATATTIYSPGATNLGTISAAVEPLSNYVLAESIVGTLGILAFMTTDGAGWFLYSDSNLFSFPTFSGDITNNDPVVTGITTTGGMYKGQAISATSIPADTRILSVDSATQITLTQNATATGSRTITRSALAKIIDSDFPSDANSIVAMDGRFFVGTDRGIIAQSGLNDPASWAASDVINADNYGDGIRFIFKQNQYIVAAGSSSIQYFRNTGNSVGSVLSADHSLDIEGLCLFSAPVPFFTSGSYCIGAKATVNSIQPKNLYVLKGVNSFSPVGDTVISGIIADLSLSRIGTAQIGNRYLALLHSASAETILAYDEDVQMFSLLSMDAAITSAFADTFTKTGLSTGFTWASDNTWTDSSSAYTLTIQTEPQDKSNGLDSVDEWADLLADKESSGTASLDVSDDDYGSWVSKGTFDMTKNKKRVNALGRTDGPRAYRIQHSANTGFRGQLLKIKHTPSQI